MHRTFRWLALALLLPTSVLAQKLLPTTVDVGLNSVQLVVGPTTAPVLDLGLQFDNASGLTAPALGLKAELITPTAPALLARLPSALTSVPAALPVMLTVQPPLAGGLGFERRVHVDLHTHLLTYTGGSRLRLFKAPVGGAFRDITTAVEPGSVRTRGTTGGFSQFLVLLDLRPTGLVVAEKVGWLNAQISALPAAERPPLQLRMAQVDAALLAGDYDDAMVAIDAARAQVSLRAGVGIPDDWSATTGAGNPAGELLAGLDTLAFSIGFLRDYGP